MKVPESIAAAARARVREAADQRARVLEAIRSGRPLDAEDNQARKLKRIQAVTGVGRQAAERLAHYEDPASLGLTGEALRRAEALQGSTIDFVSIAYLDLARAAASSVCRVVFPDLQPQGSGLMISQRLFLTNNHVIPNKADAREFLIEFNYEQDVEGRAKPVTRFALAPQEFFFTSSEDDLDFTVVAVGERLNGTGDLAGFGYCPLLDSDDKHAKADFVNIIQHPEGEYKQIVLRENRIISRLDTVLHYLTDTLPGSSGSPVFNDQWEVVALHHWGEPFTEVLLPDGSRVQKDVNEGIRISSIINLLQENQGTLSQNEQQLLAPVFNPPLRRPSLLKVEAPVRPVTPAPAVSSTPPAPSTPTQPVISDDGTATWTIPLTISVRLGEQATVISRVDGQGGTEDGAFVAAGTGEAIRIDRNYSNRLGYNPDFLPGHRVELPELTDAQQALAARQLHPEPGEDAHELKYQHFSIVMNARRRMAFFTAVNIDGSTWIHIIRETGEPRREATEVWFDDPRIAAEAQTAQDLYDNQRPQRLFDRGHLVRRQDPAWGTDNRAKRANADTFHFTNCTPQASNFNQRDQYWQGIENYILDNAKAERERISVFTGPVFADADPEYRYVQVPMIFWKVLVRVENGQLLATALRADQSEHIRRLPERLREGFDDIGEVAEYQTSVREIERLTGLDFGPLSSFDTFVPGGEATGEKRLLTSFNDIRFDRQAGQATSSVRNQRQRR